MRQGEREGEGGGEEQDRNGERAREGEGEIDESHTAVNEPPPTSSADCTYVSTYVLAMLPAYVRRYVSTWREREREAPLLCLPFIR